MYNRIRPTFQSQELKLNKISLQDQIKGVHIQIKCKLSTKVFKLKIIVNGVETMSDIQVRHLSPSAPQYMSLDLHNLCRWCSVTCQLTLWH